MWHEGDKCHDIQHHNQLEGCNVCSQAYEVQGQLCLVYHYQQDDLYCLSRHNTGPSVFFAVQLESAFEGKAFEGRAFEGKLMVFEGIGRPFEEVGRTEEIVGSAGEGKANFLDELERALQGKATALQGKL